MNRIDSHKRSLLKAAIYKLGSVILLATLSWIFTRDLITMSGITLSYELIAIIGYYVHERIWERVTWGRRLKDGL
ncbi:DUF2061 domain-containing protein [Chloroflexota bacterium]